MTTSAVAMRRVVGIGDLAVSRSDEELLVTYALGSCVGVTAYDATARVGALLHAMLPSATLDPARADRAPATYVDSGLAQLLDECCRLGAHKSRLVMTVAGGAALREGGADQFKIGKRNVLALRQLLWKEGLMLRAHDVGGSQSRTVSLEMSTGEVTLTTFDSSTPGAMRRAVSL